ncbi:MAG: hypothetical protein EOP06_24145, partial [Proteobacteria bacterium]
MELAARIAEIQERCSKLEAPKNVRDRFISELEYFRIQALCDLDRRDKPEVIKQNWHQFLRSSKGAGFIERL